MASFLLRAAISFSAVLLSAASSPDTSPLSGFQHASIITSSQLQDWRHSSPISFVYFFTKNVPSVRTFLEEYEKAAKYLKVYNISLAVFDCGSDAFEQKMCKKEKVSSNIYTYLNGSELLTLSLDTMFDVDSIMSNALHLTLLHQVPIIHSQQERQDLQKSVFGRQDILIAFPEAFGTDEHRVFMEMAYIFQDHFKFAVTTQFRAIQDLKHSEVLKSNMGLAMWVLFCSDSSAEEGNCNSSLYRGKVSLTAMANFVQKLTEKNVYHVPADGLSEVFTMTDTVPIIFIYTSKDVEHETKSVVELIKFEFKGMAKAVVVDMDNEECNSLAEQQGVPGNLPAFGARKDGVMTFLDDYEDWSLKKVQEFIRSIIFTLDKDVSESDSKTAQSAGTGSEYEDAEDDMSAFILEVQRQDDQVAEAVFALNNQKMELDHVPALMKKTFYTAVRSANLKLVLFYFPFDHISLAFLREFGHAAEILARNFSMTDIMAHVNCFDATDLCAAENITTFPVLRVFQKDKDSQDYLDSLDSESVIKAVKLLHLKSPVQLRSEEEFQKFLKGEHPWSFHKFTPSSALLLASQDDSYEERLFSNVANSLSMKTAFGIVTGDVSRSVAKTIDVSVPSVVAYNRADPDKPIRILREEISESTLKDLVMNSLIVTVPELTVMNLPALYAKKKPFVILFMDPSDTVSAVAMATFKQVAISGQFENALFCWMNAQPKTIGLKILSVYAWSTNLPMITVVDHSLGELFNYHLEKIELENTKEWLTDVFARRVRPSKTLEHTEWVPPGPHYDFLAMIDKMEADGAQAETLDDDYWYQVEQQRKARQPNREEALRIDSEKREELLELRKSQLYHQRPEPHEGSQNLVGKLESPPTSGHPHLEL